MRAHLALLAAAGLTASLPARADFADHYAKQYDIPANKAPVSGHSHVLVLPIEVAGNPPLDMAGLRSFFGSDPQGFVAYYATASHGLYSVEATVVDPVEYATCPLPPEFVDCAVPRGNIDALSPALDIIRDALTQVHDRGIDFHQFDANGVDGGPDGAIDGFLFLTNTDFGGIALPIDQLNTGGSNLTDGGKGGPFILDGIQIPYVSIAGSQEVLLHEFGHQLGLTDLYHASDPNGGLDLSLMGNWSYVSQPPLLDAESRYRMGWAHTVDVTQPATITLDPAEGGGAVLKVGGPSEYFLVENRGPGAVTDQQLDQRGVAIYHVDRSVGPSGDEGQYINRLISCVECDEFHPYILNEISSGTWRWIASTPPPLDDELFLPGSSLGPDTSDVAFSSSHPVASTNWYSGQESGITIAVGALDGGSFQVQVTVPSSTCAPPGACPPGWVCPDEACYAPPAVAPPPAASTPKHGCGAADGPGDLGLAALLLAPMARRRRRLSPS